MVNKCCSALISDEYIQECRVSVKTTVDVQWDIYVQSGRHICLKAYAINVECMYTSVPGNIADYSEFK